MGPDHLVRAVGAVWGASVAATVAYLVGRRPPAAASACGTAAWDDGGSLVTGAGLIVGRSRAGLLRYAGEGHLLTVAPTRSGKGVSAVMPNLLTFPGSIIVTDPKGENYAVTAARRRAMGSRVLAYDPFGVVAPPEERATYNPLDRIDTRTADAVDDARLLADMMVVSDGRSEAFWEEEARAALVGLILHVAAGGDRGGRSLSAVRACLTRPPLEFKSLLSDMASSPAAGGLVQRAAGQLLQKSARERAAVLSTAQSHTHFLDSPSMAAVLDATRRPAADPGAAGISPTDSGSRDAQRRRDPGAAGISPTDSGSRDAQRRRDPGAAHTTYLVLPPERLDGYRRWLRIMIGSMLNAITKRGAPGIGRVVFLLDEFAHLGRMRPVERGISLVGGYGVSFWLLIQDLAQLRAVYSDSWPTFLANADVLQAFGINDWETADHLSRLAGDATVRVTTESRTRRARVAESVSERGRRLITADEVRRLAPDLQLVFVRGRSPIAAGKVNYLRDPEFSTLAAPNPFHNVAARPVA